MDEKIVSASLLNDYLNLSRRDQKAVKKALSNVDQLRLKRFLQNRSKRQKATDIVDGSRLSDDKLTGLSPWFDAHLANLSKFGETGPATLAFIVTARKAGIGVR